MVKYNNYLRNDPFSSFSQLNIDDRFYKNILVPIINSFKLSEETKRKKHSPGEFSIVMFLNALLGESPNTGTQLNERRLNTLLKDKWQNHVKQTRILPHPSQMTKHARKFSMIQADCILRDINQSVLKLLKACRLIPKKLKIAFDFKKDLYYGEKDSPYVIGILAERGTKKAFKWHTCAIVVKGVELHVGSKMVRKGDSKLIFIQEMVEFLQGLGFEIELSLIDREYYSRKIFEYLTSRNIPYICPVRGSKKLNAQKEEALKNTKKRVQSYQMQGTYIKGKGYWYYSHNVGYYAKKRRRFNRIRAEYRNKTRDLKEILGDIFVLASNQVFSAPIEGKKYTFYKIREDYGGRWRIETDYRETNPFITYSTSKIPEVRNLYFIIALLLFNLWVLMNLFLHVKKRWEEKEPKAYFKECIQEVFLLGLQTCLGLDPPDIEFCRTEQINKMGCMII